MRLIDADALFSKLENAGWYDNADRDDVAEELLLSAPTIDAVSVVRCAECKYQDNCKKFIVDMKDTNCVKPITFCSYGERKDGAE